MFIFLQAGVPYDVLKRHQATNRRCRSPSPDYLNDVRNNGGRRLSKKRRNPSENDQGHESGQAHQTEGGNDGSLEEGDEECQEEEQAEKSASRSKKKKLAAPKDTTIAFYTPRWRVLLDRAKARMRLHTAIENAFPKLEVAVDGQCSEVLHEIIAYYKMKKWDLDGSTFNYLIRSLCLNRILCR